MATKRIKDISTTATTFAADDFIALDASSVGTRKMAKASLITQVGANYLEKADNLSDVAEQGHCQTQPGSPKRRHSSQRGIP